MAGFNMADYVDVAERINEFYERYPNGSLRTGTAPHVLEIGGRTFIAYHAQAFRNPDDMCPCDGWAWEPVPGPTQFTKDSELMNAETAAWGRAIVALGFKTKKIASAQEVRARQPAGREPAVAAGVAEEAKPRPATPAPKPGLVTEAQRKRLFAIKKERGVPDAELRAILAKETGQESTAQIPAATFDAVIAALEAWEDVPFE